MAGIREPDLPMMKDDEIQIENTDHFKKALEDWKTHHESAVLRLLLRAQLRITIYGAIQLPKTDAGGTCDAYIKAVVGTQHASSDVKYRSFNPRWGIELKGGHGFTGQTLLIDCRNPKDQITVELWDFDELKALDIKTRQTTVTRNDEIIGVAFPAKLEELLSEGSSKRDRFKVKDPETGLRVRGHTQLLDERDKDTKLDIDCTCIPAWKMRLQREREEQEVCLAREIRI